jgi:nucleotide-binding universal stress UspA family protein
MSFSFRRILLPTDFSELAACALPYARGLADAFDSQFHCLHVVDDVYQYWSAAGPEGIPVGPPPEEFVALGERRMKDFAAEHLQGLDPAATTAVRVGRPFAQIISYARENKIDLIVMGTHGRGAIAHMLLGSTTEKVVRKAGCAVLTARQGEHDFVMP